MPKLLRKKGFFDLYGFDFMVSTSPLRADKLLLLEVNTNPALSLGTKRYLSSMTMPIIPYVLIVSFLAVIDAHENKNNEPNDVYDSL